MCKVQKISAAGDLLDKFASFTRKSRTFLLPAFLLAASAIPPSAFAVQYDGPAQLPIASVSTAMSGTPAPGSIIAVNAGGDLQAALNNAHCGDKIELQAGATFTGRFTVPAKGCDINHWIIVRTSAPDSALPPEGQRMTPCYAGIASLKGRPSYPCPNPANVLAKVQLASFGDGPFRFADGANFYRFVGLEITRPVGTSGKARLITSKGIMDHFILDRSWLHGAPQDETSVGVGLNGMTYAGVIDSYFSDFHCIAVTGTCTDAHAVGGGVSDTQDGPFLIQNNFLEASGQSILFGGGPATKTPTDISILNNHMWKPWQWMQGTSGFVGATNGEPFIVKNHVELKNAARVLIDSNLMENVWGGFSQTGYSILLTPKNQKQGTTFVCPVCEVTDVTIRNVHIAHAGAGMQLATALSGDGTNGAPAKAGARWSIHDVVLEDLNPNYGGGGVAFQISNSWPTNPLNNLSINHITAFPYSQNHMMILGNKTSNQQMYGLIFRNNLILAADHPIWNSNWGTSSCAYSDIPAKSIPKCFATYTFANNGLIAPPPAFPSSTWPANNMFPQSIDYVEFTNYNNGNGGNYELRSTSPYKNAGSDGKDLGANIAGLNQALAAVE